MLKVIDTPLYEAVVEQKTMFIVLKGDNTDAAPELRPPQQQRVPNRDANGIVDYHEEAEEKADRLWRTKLGGYLYDHVVKVNLEREGINHTPPDKIILATFPRHYSLWVHKKGNPHDPRKDHYLHGSRFVHVFRSSSEFCFHLKWLLDGQPKKASGKPDCKCCYCDGSRTQGEISQEMGNYHPNKGDSGNGGGKGGRRGSGGGTKPRPPTTTEIPYKDYRKFD